MTRICQLLLLPVLISATFILHAATPKEVDGYADAALEQLYAQSDEARRLGEHAAAILVFPMELKEGTETGGEYGEGKMIADGETLGYYHIAFKTYAHEGSARNKSQVLMLMTPAIVDELRTTDGWSAGIDGEIALVPVGRSEVSATTTGDEEPVDPIFGFIFSADEVLSELTFEHSVITQAEE